MDYKIHSIKENEDGTVTVVQRIYEGAETTENEFVSELNADGVPVAVEKPVTRYRRTKLLDEVEYVVEVKQARREDIVPFLNKKLEERAIALRKRKKVRPEQKNKRDVRIKAVERNKKVIKEFKPRRPRKNAPSR